MSAHPEIHGAAELDLTFLHHEPADQFGDVDGRGYAALVERAARLVWPNVDFCSNNDLNLAVRGNNVDDVTELVDVGSLTEMTPDELRAIIAELEPTR